VTGAVRNGGKMLAKSPRGETSEIGAPPASCQPACAS